MSSTPAAYTATSTSGTESPSSAILRGLGLSSLATSASTALRWVGEISVGLAWRRCITGPGFIRVVRSTGSFKFRGFAFAGSFSNKVFTWRVLKLRHMLDIKLGNSWPSIGIGIVGTIFNQHLSVLSGSGFKAALHKGILIANFVFLRIMLVSVQHCLLFVFEHLWSFKLPRIARGLEIVPRGQFLKPVDCQILFLPHFQSKSNILRDGIELVTAAQFRVTELS
jgi:hypothetical protein